MSEPVQRPRIVRMWEDLPIGVQIAVVLPTAVLGLWAAHVWLLGQPLGRGFTYGGFWGTWRPSRSSARRARNVRAGGPPGHRADDAGPGRHAARDPGHQDAAAVWSRCRAVVNSEAIEATRDASPASAASSRSLPRREMSGEASTIAARLVSSAGTSTV